MGDGRIYDTDGKLVYSPVPGETHGLDLNRSFKGILLQQEKRQPPPAPLPLAPGQRRRYLLRSPNGRDGAYSILYDAVSESVHELCKRQRHNGWAWCEVLPSDARSDRELIDAGPAEMPWTPPATPPEPKLTIPADIEVEAVGDLVRFRIEGRDEAFFTLRGARMVARLFDATADHMEAQGRTPALPVRKVGP